LGVGEGGDIDGALVDGAGVVVVAHRNGVTAALAGTLADIAPIVVGAEETERGGDLHIGLGGVPFAEKEVEPVVGAGGETHAIHLHLTSQGVVHTSQVHSQATIQKHEHVIITSELEHLTAVVSKSGVDLKAKREVVVARGTVFPTLAIDGEEICVVVVVLASAVLGQRNVIGDADGLVGVVEPVVERGCAVHS
jgi:flagellar hook protein FlgE